MSLPSKYAPGGLSLDDQNKVIVSGKKHPSKPVNYTVKIIENRINSALSSSDHQNDIEMIPMDDDQEVNVISEFVRNTRNRGELEYQQVDSDDRMEVENITVVEGNISYLIVDTNFLLSHLNILDGLKGLAADFGLKLIIPITVIKELDGLKKSTRRQEDSRENGPEINGKSMGHLARWANEWIYSSLAESSDSVKGQKLGQWLEKDTRQDDAILDCCLYFQKHNPEALIVLLSNDKNFCLKALTNDILTVSFRKSMTAELIAKVVYNENVSRFGKRKSHISSDITPHHSSDNITQSSIRHNEPELVGPSKEWIEESQDVQNGGSKPAVEQVYKEIQQVALAIVHQCMFSAYGDDLDLLRNYDKESVITLNDCSQVFIRFWQPVFRQYFDRTSVLPFEEAGRGKLSVKTPKMVDIPMGKSELTEFVNFWCTILGLLYSAEMDATQNKALEFLTKRWEKMAATVE